MTEELPMTIPERWTVEPVFRRQTKVEMEAGKPKELKHYALMFGGEIHKKAVTERETEGLREMARFLNRRKLSPRPRVQCLADTNIPPLPRKPKSRSANPEPTSAQI